MKIAGYPKSENPGPYPYPYLDIMQKGVRGQQIMNQRHSSNQMHDVLRSIF